MIRLDEDALICDFAEYYHIYDYRGLPAGYAATLACGLREDSRIQRSLAGRNYDKLDMLLAAAVDRLSVLVWAQTEDGQKGRNKPAMLVDALLKSGDDEIQPYESIDEFKRARARLIGGTHGD